MTVRSISFVSTTNYSYQSHQTHFVTDAVPVHLGLHAKMHGSADPWDPCLHATFTVSTEQLGHEEGRYWSNQASVLSTICLSRLHTVLCDPTTR